jgi:hypothetical protein
MVSGRIALFLEVGKTICMKKILTLVFLVAFVGSLKAQNTVSQPVAEPLIFPETEHDFGKIPQGKPVYYKFAVKNEGITAIKIENVAATCGCTTPEWSREAVEPGATAYIKVGYNAAADGAFDKFITVTYNGNVHKQIKIKGFVWKAPTGAAPANASVQFLKQQIL